LKNKVVIITGASSGIGKALAYRFANAGSTVVLAARNRPAIEALAAELKLQQPDIEVLAVTTDVSRVDDCRQLIAAAFEQFGRIDVLINNAGISMRALFKDCELSVLEKLMQVNFWGAVYCTKFALPYVLQSRGSIVGVSSIAGYRGLPARSGYSASKFALQGFLESVRTELLHTGVHVLVAAPGFTASNIRNVALNQSGNAQGESPLDEKKMMSAEAVADAIFKAVKKRKRTIILTRQGKLTVFLNKWFPGWMDRLVFNHFRKEKDSPLASNI
jgi:short-subunit dehydrogenase